MTGEVGLSLRCQRVFFASLLAFAIPALVVKPKPLTPPTMLLTIAAVGLWKAMRLTSPGYDR